MAYIERRRNLWYALLTIPEDVRGKLDKLRFVQSLGTPDKAEAMILAAPLLAKWKAEIREARGATNALTEEANRWKKHLLRQTSVDQERGDEFGTGALELHDLLRERTETLAKTKGATVADTFHGVVTGKLTTTGAYETEWKAQLQATPKTKDQMEKDLPLLIARFTSLEEITKSSVKKWLDDLRSQGKSVATHSTRRIKAMSDITNPNFFILVTEGPLVGPFFSEEDAKSWAENAGMAYKRIDRVKHYSSR